MSEGFRFKPCPFCGEVDAISFLDAADDETHPATIRGLDVQVICVATIGGCGSSSGFNRGEAEALAAWNRRAALDREQVT